MQEPGQGCGDIVENRSSNKTTSLQSYLTDSERSKLSFKHLCYFESFNIFPLFDIQTANYWDVRQGIDI